MFPIPSFPQTLENTAIYTVFFNFSMFQCRWPTLQTVIQKHCFLQRFYNVFRQKHRNLHVFRHQVGPKHKFFFSNALASKSLSKYRYLHGFFIFVRSSIAGSLPKWPKFIKIPFQYPLKLRHPKIVEKTRKHHLILVSVRNRSWPPPS